MNMNRKSSKEDALPIGPLLLRLRSLRGFMPHATNIALMRMLGALDTRRSRMSAAWWGIRLGEYSVFCGVPIFRRHPTATIVIGSCAVFQSAEWSNTIGLNRRCIISASRNATIQIGDSCGFSATVIAATKSIMIGNRVLCGANCTIVDTDCHPLDPISRASHQSTAGEPIIIEDDTWLGKNVEVLKGCSIGKGTVVAANSVVTHSLPTGVLAGGVPARVIRELKHDD